MNKKIFILLASVFAIFFLTAQTCTFGGVNTGLAADCVGEGDIVCDSTDAYQCQLASYGIGYYVTRASGYDVSDCGAVDITTDTDGDGVADIYDVCAGYDDNENTDMDEKPNGCDPDDDNDGVADTHDVCAGFDDNEDIDSDGKPNDCDIDDDGDGFADKMEIKARSDPEDATNVPSAADVDHDDMADDWESMYGLDSTDSSDAGGDEDSDGLTNLEEYEAGTDPTNADSDGDGFTDSEETLAGFDPTDSSSYPLCIGDTDPDQDPYTFGSVKGYLSSYGTGAEVIDTCVGDDLYQYYCVDANTYAQIDTSTDCSDTGEICKDGICQADEGTAGGISTTVNPSASKVVIASSSSSSLGEQFYTATDTFTSDDGKTRTIQFKLEDFTNSVLIKYGGNGHFESLNDDLGYHTAELYSSYADDYIIYAHQAGDGAYYFDFTDEDSGYSYAKFADSDKLNPHDWVVLKLDAKVASGHENDDYMVLAQKQTNICGYPLYALIIHDSYYRFYISIDGNRYILSSEDADVTVDTNWHQVMGTYDGETAELWVSGEKVDSLSVSGNIKTGYSEGSLTLGYGTVCDGSPFYGYMDDIYIWGE